MYAVVCSHVWLYTPCVDVRLCAAVSRVHSVCGHVCGVGGCVHCVPDLNGNLTMCFVAVWHLPQLNSSLLWEGYSGEDPEN